MKRFVGTIPKALQDVWPQLDGCATSQGWSVSPSSTIYKRFYSKGMSMWSNGSHMTVYLEPSGETTRITMDLSSTTLVDTRRAQKVASKFVEQLGGAILP